MSRHVTIQDIEAALRYWGLKEPVLDNRLGPHTRVLADVYGLMIFERRQSVTDEMLTEDQRVALTSATDHGSSPQSAHS